MLRNIKIGKKILLLIIISVLFIGIVGVIGYTYMNQMAASAKSMYNERLLPVKMMQMIQINNRKIDTYVLELMITTDPERNKTLLNNINNNLNAVDQIR